MDSGVCICIHLVNGTGSSPSPGQPTPGVVKQDKSSGGSVDMTKTRSDPQRVGMYNGERPIGAAKGKHTKTMVSCQTPPLPCTAKAHPVERQGDSGLEAEGIGWVGGWVGPELSERQADRPTRRSTIRLGTVTSFCGGGRRALSIRTL